FTTVSLPAGFGITYGSSSVTLTVTNTTLVTALVIAQPRGTATQFHFSFPTVRGQNYIVERNDDLSQANWVFYANVLGDGSAIEITAPATNSNRRFFRVRMR
ncbi:MAG: hypothetical protein ACREP9_16220, partial [Candidatus Dormibacteraceae bacterium]